MAIDIEIHLPGADLLSAAQQDELGEALKPI